MESTGLTAAESWEPQHATSNEGQERTASEPPLNMVIMIFFKAKGMMLPIEVLATADSANDQPATSDRCSHSHCTPAPSRKQEEMQRSQNTC